MPYRFSSFKVEGTLTNLAGIEAGETGEIRREELGARHDELPLSNQVIAFPKC
jgi:hypothetical protein